METFWEGYEQEKIAELQRDIPREGPVPNEKQRPMLEEWRRFQNAYYRKYNDGDRVYLKLRYMAQRFGMTESEISMLDYEYQPRVLEQLGRKVLAAAWKEREAFHAAKAEDMA